MIEGMRTGAAAKELAHRALAGAVDAWVRGALARIVREVAADLDKADRALVTVSGLLRWRSRWEPTPRAWVDRVGSMNGFGDLAGVVSEMAQRVGVLADTFEAAGLPLTVKDGLAIDGDWLRRFSDLTGGVLPGRLADVAEAVDAACDAIDILRAKGRTDGRGRTEGTHRAGRARGSTRAA